MRSYQDYKRYGYGAGTNVSSAGGGTYGSLAARHVGQSMVGSTAQHTVGAAHMAAHMAKFRERLAAE